MDLDWLDQFVTHRIKKDKSTILIYGCPNCFDPFRHRINFDAHLKTCASDYEQLKSNGQKKISSEVDKSEE